MQFMYSTPPVCFSYRSYSKSGPAIAGYMTGSAITITLSQLPALAGTGDIVDTHGAPYLTLGHFLQNLPSIKVDLAFGLVGLVILYAIKMLCARLSARTQGGSKWAKGIFYFGIMRSGLLVIFGTFLSFLIHIGRTTSPIHIIKDVPAGFDAMGIPGLNFEILASLSGTLPSIVLILILEHVSVAKSFGRIYNYTISPDQEILAIGLSNIIGSFFG